MKKENPKIRIHPSSIHPLRRNVFASGQMQRESKNNKINKTLKKKDGNRQLALAFQRSSFTVKGNKQRRAKIESTHKIRFHVKDIDEKETNLKINLCLRSLNSNDICINKIKKSSKEELKGYITPIFFFQTLIYLIKVVWTQIIMAALSNSPCFQLLLMSVIEFCYASLTTYCFIAFFKYQTVIGFIAKIGQSLALALIYHQFYAIFLLEKKGGYTFEHQERTIKYIIFGGIFEYGMIALRLIVLCFEGCLTKFGKKG